MNVTAQQLKHQYKALPVTWRAAIGRVARNIATPHVDNWLLLAVASRETNMENITGDGGHGRGMWQQDDRWQEDFLAHNDGCKPGTSIVAWDTCLPKGRVPTITAGARRCAVMLELGIDEVARARVPFGERTRVAVAGYNCGIGRAIQGFRAGDPDMFTAHRDYSADVMARAAALRKI